MSELAILKTIIDNCGSKCTGANLDVQDVQNKLQITKPAVSYILNSLEKKNYIKREIDAKDRRKLSIYATPKGQTAAAESDKTFNQTWDTLLERFGEEDMLCLIELLNRLNDICADFDQDRLCNKKD
nr:MarR family transcriptional regulator [Aequitasia blattaphilus]